MTKRTYFTVALTGRKYTYRTELPIQVGDLVRVPVRHGNKLNTEVEKVLSDAELVQFLETSNIALSDIKEVSEFAEMNEKVRAEVMKLHAELGDAKLTKDEQNMMLNIIASLRYLATASK